MLDQALNTIREELALTESVICEETSFGLEIADRTVSHMSGNAGKMIRPAVFLLSARAAGAPADAAGRLPRIAAAIELVHTASLMHDDVIDAAAIRRGAASANSIWGDKASILAGDLLWSVASRLILESGDERLTRAVVDCIRRITLGEMLELSLRGDASANEDDCLRVIDGKTSSLFALAAGAGGMTAGADGETIERLEEFGRHMGTAYQLADDALDYASSQSELGKSPGSDLATGTPTYPLVAALRSAGEADRSLIAGALGSGDCPSRPDAMASVSRLGGVSMAFELSRDFSARAKLSLDGLPDSEAKASLAVVADFVSMRSA